MMIIYFILLVVSFILFAVMTAFSIAEYVTKRRSSRREQTRIFFETLRAEKKLHRLASDAFASMMEVARSSVEPRDRTSDDQGDDDAS